MKHFWNTTKKGLALFFIILFMVPMGVFLATPQEAHAQSIGEFVYDLAQDVWAAIEVPINAAIKAASIVTAEAQQFLALKEGWLDGLAWMVVDITIQTITRDIVTWINNGFEGSPAFITDFGGFLTDVADQTAGEFIASEFVSGGQFAFLCDPFKGQIQLALALSYGGTPDKHYCRLSDITTNVENFVSGVQGSFSDGGWQSWLQLSTRDNAYNKYLQAHAELAISIGNEVYREQIPLDWANGFLAWKECAGGPSGGGGGPGRDGSPGTAGSDAGGSVGGAGGPPSSGTTNSGACEVVTPGSVIEEQLNNTLDLGNRRLTVADEINEVVAALLTQLVKQALGGTGGVRGYTRAYAGSTSFFDRPEFQNQVPENLFDGSGAFPTNPATAREYETQFRNNVATLFNQVRSVEQLAEEYAACDASRGAIWLDRISPTREELEAELASSTINIAVLDEYDRRIDEANTAEELQELFDEFQAYAETGAFHTIDDVVQSEQEMNPDFPNTIAAQMEEYEGQLQNLLTQCRARNGGEGTNFDPDDPSFPGGV